ncbi:hypothetical protein EJ02DRAFT_464475 [Clathrospora elynae]|uniref:Uncharacterized protein n=1 Tax=Clathrospora elynae TaxID=706981 RepID=A0A6A5SUJ5_9PLEO|nr:hypothetical protein EJ02DRAFT_464475 [Clathrospora elynae]
MARKPNPLLRTPTWRYYLEKADRNAEVEALSASTQSLANEDAFISGKAASPSRHDDHPLSAHADSSVQLSPATHTLTQLIQTIEALRSWSEHIDQANLDPEIKLPMKADHLNKILISWLQTSSPSHAYAAKSTPRPPFYPSHSALSPSVTTMTSIYGWRTSRPSLLLDATPQRVSGAHSKPYTLLTTDDVRVSTLPRRMRPIRVRRISFLLRKAELVAEFTGEQMVDQDLYGMKN